MRTRRRPAARYCRRICCRPALPSATRDWVALFDSAVTGLTAQGAAKSIIDVYQFYLDIVSTAYQENRGLTGPVPLCGPFPTRVPATTAYTKPLVILINELSSGPAE